MKRSFRLQSAMEYLMTYGWAILIIAVVLGMLFQMGVFSTKSYSPTVQAGSCRVLRTATTASLAGVCASQLPKYVAQVNGQSYISAPSTGFPTITSSSGAVTVSGWVYLTSSSSSIFAINLYTPSFLAFIDVDGCTVGTQEYLPMTLWQGAAYNDECVLPSQFPLNQWVFVVSELSYNSIYGYVGASGKIYSNGGALAYPSSNTITPTGFYIGKDPFTGIVMPKGSMISNFQVYNTLLDSASVTALYQKGIGGVPVDPNHIVGWWPLNGDVNDYSGNNNNVAPASLVFTSQYGS